MNKILGVAVFLIASSLQAQIVKLKPKVKVVAVTAVKTKAKAKAVVAVPAPGVVIPEPKSLNECRRVQGKERRACKEKFL